jgi:hypothetical protein
VQKSLKRQLAEWISGLYPIEQSLKRSSNIMAKSLLQMLHQKEVTLIAVTRSGNRLLIERFNVVLIEPASTKGENMKTKTKKSSKKTASKAKKTAKKAK